MFLFLPNILPTLFCIITYYLHNCEAIDNKTANHVHNLSSKFTIRTGIGVEEILPSELPKLARRLSELEKIAFENAALKKLGLSRHFKSASNMRAANEESFEFVRGDQFRTQITDISKHFEGGIQLEFVLFFSDNPIPAEVIVGDISQLSLSHISSILQYPILFVNSKFDNDFKEESRWWIIASIIGSGLFVVFCGWTILFVYYNSCGRPQFHKNTQNVELQPQQDTPQTTTTPTTTTTRTTTYSNSAQPLAIANTVTKNTSTFAYNDPALQLSSPNYATKPERNYKEKNEILCFDAQTQTDNTVSGISKSTRVNRKLESEKLVADPHKNLSDSMSDSKSEEFVPDAPCGFDSHQTSHVSSNTQAKPPKKWTPYFAGDQVATIMATQRLPTENSHPTPAMPTEFGVLDIR